MKDPESRGETMWKRGIEVVIAGLLLSTSIVTAAAGATALHSARVAAPPVQVVSKGYSVKAYQFGAADAYFGLALRNTSSHLSAVGVTVTVTFLTAAGPWVRDSFLLDGIPPGRTFYLSGTANGNPKPRAMQVSVHVERATQRHLELPVIMAPTITRGASHEARVAVTDPYSASRMLGFAPDGTLYFVYFGRGGRILGGDQVSFSQYPFPASGRKEMYTAGKPVPTGTVRVRASADLCNNGLGLVTNCPVYG